MAMLDPCRAQIATRLDEDHLLLTRIQELLEPQLPVNLNDASSEAGLWKQPRSTVRMAPTARGEVAEMDFEKLCTLINPLTGKRQIVHGLLIVLVYSRYAFLWPLVQQTVEATIDGLEQAWRFFVAGQYASFSNVAQNRSRAIQRPRLYIVNLQC
jgi:hypothetical protein